MLQNNQVATLVFSEESIGRNATKISLFNLRFHYLLANTVGPAWGTGGLVDGDYLHHIHFACEGEALWIHGDTQLKLEPGNAYWVPGNTPIVRVCENFYRHYALVLSCELAPGVDLFSNWPQRRPLHLGPWCEQEWLADWTERPSSLNTQMRLQGQLFKWLAEQFDDLAEIVTVQTQKYVRYTRVFELIENSLGANLQVKDLARAHGTSPRAFSMAFTRDLGLSPKSYLNYRLNMYACRLLVIEDWSIKRIASHLHFSDDHYFNRFFSKMNSIPPHKYRQLFLSHDR
jgi:AraC-like DNA-binding protein